MQTNIKLILIETITSRTQVVSIIFKYYKIFELSSRLLKFDLKNSRALKIYLNLIYLLIELISSDLLIS